MLRKEQQTMDNEFVVIILLLAHLIVGMYGAVKLFDYLIPDEYKTKTPRENVRK